MLLDIVDEALVSGILEGVVVFGNTNDSNRLFKLFSNSADCGLRRTAIFDKM